MRSGEGGYVLVGKGMGKWGRRVGGFSNNNNNREGD